MSAKQAFYFEHYLLRKYMAFIRQQKENIIKDLKEKISRQKAIIFVDFSGLKVKDLSVLREKLKQASNELKIAKKTLINIVLKTYKFKINIKKLQGEIALVFGYKDEMTPAKTIYQFSQTNQNLKILGGFIESQKKEFLDSQKIIELAKIPTREELFGQFVRTLSGPISNLVNILQGNIKGLLYILTKIKT